MDYTTYIQNFLAALQEAAPVIGIDYAEYISVEGESPLSLANKSYNREFTIVPFANLKDKILTEVAENKPSFEINTRLADKDIFCNIFPLKKANTIKGFFIFQSQISCDEKSCTILKSYLEIFKLYEEPKNTAPGEMNDKYKKELMKMRDMQAKLFPKFKDVRDLDVGSAFLPADLMSGNFIDAFYIDKNTYQLITCEMIGDNTASIFAGTAIRALVRSETAKKMSPSGIIITITEKLRNIISGVQSQLFLTIFQINTKSGKALISSLGALSLLFYTKAKNSCLDLKKTSIGKSFDTRISFKDISLFLQPGDILLYYSHIINNITNKNGDVVYNDLRLSQNFTEAKETTSLEIVHSIISNLYEYTDYAPLNNDIILLCVKK